VRLFDQGIDHGFGILVRHLRQYHIACVALSKRGDLTVVRTNDQVALPVNRYRVILNSHWSLPDGYHIIDLTPAIAFLAGMPRTTCRTMVSQGLL
jgi:hypothetical protein